MEIGEEEETIYVEPIVDPFETDTPDREPEPVPEEVPA